MLPYCLKCRKNTESKNPKVVRTKNRRIMPPLKLIKEQEAKGLLGNIPGIKIPILGDTPLVNALF